MWVRTRGTSCVNRGKGDKVTDFQRVGKSRRHRKPHIKKAAPSIDERPFSSSLNGMKVGRYNVDWSSSRETVGVDMGGKSLFFAQGEEAQPYLDILERNGPGALLEDLDSAGVLKFRTTKK